MDTPSTNIIPFPQKPIRARQVAEMIGVSYATIKVWAARGLLDSIRIPVGSQYRYDPAQVQARFKSGGFATHAR